MPNTNARPAEGPNTGGLLRSASILSIGNFASRVLGLLREAVIARYFGTEGVVGAFVIASQVPTLIYDFLIGGMLSAALVPVLSEQVQKKRQTEFVQLANILITIFGAILLLVVLLLEFGAPLLTQLLAGGFEKFDPQLLPLTTNLIRLVTPAIFFFGMAGLMTAILYSLQRFSFPAIATAIYNIALILAAPLLAKWLGVTSLAIGILAGSIAQWLVMAWDVRRAGIQWQFRLDWRHPALRRILMLYLPNAVALLVALFQVGLDRRLASGAGERSIAWMRYATTLQQLPLGLISVAIALAALPKLSQFYAASDETNYKQTLARGLRMVLLLVAPAAVGLWLLGEPVSRIIFEGMKFRSEDSVQVAHALSIYLIGMLFAAIDFPLNYAFYARNNTLLPAIVGVISVVVYIIVALWALPRLGYIGLVWGDTAKQAAHALIMIAALWWRVGRLEAKTVSSAIKILAASLLMAMVVWALRTFNMNLELSSRLGAIVAVAIAGGGGVIIYGVALRLLQLDEITLVLQQIRSRLHLHTSA